MASDNDVPPRLVLRVRYKRPRVKEPAAPATAMPSTTAEAEREATGDEEASSRSPVASVNAAATDRSGSSCSNKFSASASISTSISSGSSRNTTGADVDSSGPAPASSSSAVMQVVGVDVVGRINGIGLFDVPSDYSFCPASTASDVEAALTGSSSSITTTSTSASASSSSSCASGASAAATSLVLQSGRGTEDKEAEEDAGNAQGAEAAERESVLEAMPFRFDGPLLTTQGSFKDAPTTHQYNFQPSLLQQGYRTFHKRYSTKQVHFGDPIPTAAPPELLNKVRRSQAKFDQLVKVMKQLFDQRPIWRKPTLEYELKDKYPKVRLPLLLSLPRVRMHVHVRVPIRVSLLACLAV